jgi:methionyl-tRNA formyltransferase
MNKILICGYRDWSYNVFKKIEYLCDGQKEIIYVDDKDLLEQIIGETKPEIIFFVGWSWIIKENIIDKYKCICLHPSPLPKYRGGSPTQHQIINGEKESAVTLFEMDEGIDTGDILFQKSFSLDGELNDILKKITDVGIEGIMTIIDGNYEVIKQDNKKATFYKRRKPEMSEINIEDFKNYSARDLYNKIRALQHPYPNAFITCKDNTKLYLINSKIGDDE